MTNRLPRSAAALALLLPIALPAAAQTFPTDSAVLAIIKPRVDTGRYAGIVVGLVDRAGHQQVTSYGPHAGVLPFDGNTVFEIGSITKTFTAAVLADMVARRELALEDPVAKHLPPGTRIPERDGKQISLLDLATHTSGLPRLPGNLVIANPDNPYESYTPAMLYEFLARYTLPRGIGDLYEYSNLGSGILGQALSHRSGKDYETLVHERVTSRLGMHDTRIKLTPSMNTRVAPGHDESGETAGLWDLPTLAGAGALRSTVNDMLLYIRANADSTSQPLGSMLAATHRQQRPGPTHTISVGLSWHRLVTRSGRTLIWHNGGTGGYRTFVGFDEASGLGVVVFSNTAVSVDDIGMHLLDGSVPLTPIPRRRVATWVAPEILERYVGEYEVGPAFAITITREGSTLYAQATAQQRYPIFAETDSEFFFRVADAQLTFTKDPAGTVIGLVLHQNGESIPGRKK